MENIPKWLGHSNLTTMRRIYAHYDDREKADTLKAIEGAFDGKPNQGEMK
jgi:integrase